MTNPPTGFAAVENVTHNTDGSVTIFARDHLGDPIVKTFQAGEQVTVIRGGGQP